MEEINALVALEERITELEAVLKIQGINIKLLEQKMYDDTCAPPAAINGEPGDYRSYNIVIGAIEELQDNNVVDARPDTYKENTMALTTEEAIQMLKSQAATIEMLTKTDEVQTFHVAPGGTLLVSTELRAQAAIMLFAGIETAKQLQMLNELINRMVAESPEATTDSVCEDVMVELESIYTDSSKACW